MNIVRTFQIAAVVLAFVALYFAITDPRSDYLFAAVILAICAGFLAYRFHLKDQIGGGNPKRGAPAAASASGVQARSEGAPMQVTDDDKD